MKEYIAFDSHKHYTLAEVENASGSWVRQERIEHERGAIRRWLSRRSRGNDVAVEAIGNWYWIVEEIAQAEMAPKLVHPRKAKLMMGMINKTDKLDVHGLNRLQRNGTLPTVWVPPPELRDLRELTRCRMVMRRQCTELKNRVLAILEKYALSPRGISDLFGRRGRAAMTASAAALPPQAHWVFNEHLEQIDALQRQIGRQESRVKELVRVTPEMKRLMTMPGVGVILSATIALEIGQIGRFPDDDHLASYAGTTPRVHASGGKVRYGRTRPDVNRILKWAFAEAANSIVVNHRRWPERYVSRLYVKLRHRRGHSRAVGALARHLAEATWHILKKDQPYLERGSRNQGQAREA
jgi:transposase